MKYLKEYGLLLLIFIVLIILLLIYYLKGDDNVQTIKLNIVPTNISKIENNSVWCPTFQLIWNDLKNEVIGQDILFIDDKDNKLVQELNKEAFHKKMLNDNYYYTNYGYMTTYLKETIENDIWKKFKEKSDILEKFNFHDNNHNYFFYAMLARKFTFMKPFDILENNTFGINESSNHELDNNVKVLFYEQDNYAVKLLTKENDEIILYKGLRKNNFNETYNYIVQKSNESDFNRNDTITIANLNFKSENNYQELTNKRFYDINGVSYTIEEIMQTINFSLDNRGGKVKSEAGMSVKYTSINDGKHFDFTDDFVLFLKDKDKNDPYLALNITNILEFQ